MKRASERESVRCGSRKMGSEFRVREFPRSSLYNETWSRGVKDLALVRCATGVRFDSGFSGRRR